ncbi:MAG: tRNA lysidine(34) synthetase TilS [Chakrabartia sp.]
MIDAAATQRFTRDLAALLPNPTGRIGLAISGGPDSLALLLLAKASLPDIVAATVDHGLRPEAADEARFVAQICANLSVDHSILTLTNRPAGNPSSWARQARYHALEDWGTAKKVRWLLTAHHADDQLETLLMRLNRGSGVAGLAGIRAQNKSVARPLLNWRKAELEDLVAQAGLQAVDDPSNRDARYDRARMRAALSKADWLDPVAAVRSASALASAETALDWTTQQLFNQRAEMGTGRITLDAADLPFELQRRLLIACLQTLNPSAAPRDDEVLRLLASLNTGQTATLAGVKCSGGAQWTFQPAPPPRTISRNS